MQHQSYADSVALSQSSYTASYITHYLNPIYRTAYLSGVERRSPVLVPYLFTAQKHCLRVLFGDREAYLNKFKTCVRSRPYGEQNLDNKFFIKEHTKPLFREHGILALQNLYTYHVYLELYKIMKFRAPISLFDEYECSARKPTLIICQVDPPDNYNLRSTKIWNVITPKLKFTDMTMSVSCLRSRLKVSLLNNQHNHTNLVWTNNDFDSRLLLFEKFEKFPQT